MPDSLPDLPYPTWRESLHTLHRFSQIVGKLCLAAAARQNHWWHVTLLVSGRGLATRPMRSGPVFTCEFDLVDHRFEIATEEGRRVSFSLLGVSVAGFYKRVLEGLAAVGVDARISHPYPFDLPDSDRPFAEDVEHAAYDPVAVTRAWVVLARMNLALEEFSSQFSGKASPVQLFWHSFDLAMARFSDRRVPMGPEVDAVTREAYSREVASFGFWFGDDSFPEPALYAYAAPEPEGLADAPLAPAGAKWRASGNGHLAVLRYADLRRSPDPDAATQEFYESAYLAGAELMGWDVERLASPGGVTDPVRERKNNG